MGGISTLTMAAPAQAGNQWKHGMCACMDDGFVPCLCNMGLFGMCAEGKMLEGWGSGSMVMWLLLGLLVTPVIPTFMTRQKAVQTYGIDEGTATTLMCACCNPCSPYTVLLEYQ